MQTKKKHQFDSAKDLFMKHNFIQEKMHSAKYVTHEFQDFGYRLAVQLNDLEHKSLYIRLAKTVERKLLEQALSFTLDYPKAKNRGKIFMWKLSEVRNEYKKNKLEREKTAKESQVKLI
jgi:hypothetical protein